MIEESVAVRFFFIFLKIFKYNKKLSEKMVRNLHFFTNYKVRTK